MSHVPVATMDDSDSSDEGSLFVSDSSSTVNQQNSSPCHKSSILSITSASSNEEAPPENILDRRFSTLRLVSMSQRNQSVWTSTMLP
jgi:hypothetical protein